MATDQVIELDCPPGVLRPGSLLGGVTMGLGLPLKDPISRVFGAWTWDYSDVPLDIWNEAVPTLEQRIKKLYAIGHIRFGRWA